MLELSANELNCDDRSRATDEAFNLDQLSGHLRRHVVLWGECFGMSTLSPHIPEVNLEGYLLIDTIPLESSRGCVHGKLRTYV